jgi:hypothetical protein
MRRLAVLLAAVLAALAVVPSVALADPPAGDQAADPCPAPEVTHSYDAARFTVHATLLASGCPAREHREFNFSAFITRRDGSTAEGHGRNVSCGPFRSASDMGPGEPPHTYSCAVEVAMDHPATDSAEYQVEVTYPVADGDETIGYESFCESGTSGTSCEEVYHPAGTGPASPGQRHGVS